MSANAEPLWVCHNLTAGYGAKEVLRGVSFEQSPAELLCLLGHNGAGKSTLLKAMFGLLPLRGGEIFYQGASTAEAGFESLRGRVAYMPEGRGTFQQLTVEENLRLGMSAARIPSKDREERLAEVFRHLPVLKLFFKRRAGLLSGGQQQMVSLGRTLLSRPTCLLLDEPSTGLAPKLFQDLMEVIVRMRTETNMTLLLVEQNVKEALHVADRVMVMRDGRIIYNGAPAELRDHKRLLELY